MDELGAADELDAVDATCTRTNVVSRMLSKMSLMDV